MHIVFVISNESSVPYFKWFAEKAVKQDEHQFSFVTLFTEKPKMIEDVGKYGWKCYWFKFDHKKRKRGMVRTFFHLYKLFRKLKPDVVHTHLFDDSLPGLFAARLAGVKIRIVTKQDTTFHYFYAPKWVIVDKFNNWNATHIVPVSKEAEKFIIEKENAPKSKITMIHHGIPPEIFTQQSEILKKELVAKYQLEGKKVIGTVARLIEWKGYRYIIEAIPIVIKKYPNTVFLFVGQGSQKEELEELAKKFNVLQYIIFTGWVDRIYTPSLYSIFDVYAHAANYEPFGFVIPEAMMNAVPVVSTPTGSALDAIQHKENGYLVKYKDAYSLAEGICYALEHGVEFKEKGRKTALEMFAFDKMWESYLELYKKALKANKKFNLHIVFLISNESSVPYFNWFAEKAAQQNELQFSFVTLFTEEPKMIEDVGKYDWKCYWIKFDHKKRKRGMVSAFFQLYKLFRKIKPDVVHTHLFDDSLPGLFAARIAGVKKRIITKADTAFHYFYASKWIVADKFNNRNATHIIPVSREAEKFIIEIENVPKEKITMIHHGIPPEISTKQSTTFKEELIYNYQLEGKIVIGTVARLVEWKGHRYIIEAIPAVIKKYPNAVFLFVGGEGDQKEELVTFAKKINVLEHIIFIEWIDRVYIPSLYSILDVYVHAANFEPFGFVIPEAMMNATPIVSTPTGAALDAIEHKVNGYLANYKDAPSLVEGICYALEHGANFKEKGRKTALEMYNFELMWKSYTNLYKKGFKN